MRSYIAKFLVFWGIVIDFVLLGGMPLSGNCAVWDELIKHGAPCDANSLPGLLGIYVFLLCGVLRLTAGLCPDSRGCWYAGMASMLLEINLGRQLWSLPSSPSGGAVDLKDGAFATCGLTFVVMGLCAPGAEPKAAKTA